MRKRWVFLGIGAAIVLPLMAAPIVLAPGKNPARFPAAPTRRPPECNKRERTGPFFASLKGTPQAGCPESPSALNGG